jgi:hypothetical protein
VIRRLAIAFLIVTVALLTYPGALLASLATRFTPPPAASPPPFGALPWLHVEHPSGELPYIADDQRRLVILHGATPAGLLEFGPGTSPLYPVEPATYGKGRCPPNLEASRYPPLCETDLKAMAALGFNVVRLPISWSVLEPERGRFNSTLLDRIAQIVDWARAVRMYVIIDMHQNAFSHYVGSGPSVKLAYNTGAPQWATFTDGLPSRVFGENREINPAVFQATTNFWYDRDGIQDEYIAALAHIAHRFKDDSVVAGYGLYNEPWIGWNLPPGFDDLLLFPFYRRVIDAITGVHDGLPCWSGFFMPAVCGYRDLGVGDRHHLFFLDSGLLREVTDFPTHLGMPVSSYPNVVFALHAYTHQYTPDKLFLGQQVPNTSYPWGGYDQGWDSAEREAKAMDLALFLEEFGTDPPFDDYVLKSDLRETERHRVGYAFWTWKENGGKSSWGIFDPPDPKTDSAGCIRPDRERMLASVYPRVSADRLMNYSYDASSGSFALRARGRAGDPDTAVYIPPEVTGEVSARGVAHVEISARDDGSRLVSVSPAGGSFTVSIAPHALALTGCA